MDDAPTAPARLRWFKFWTADELGFAELAMCPLAAQGLFARLRAYLHTVSEPYGYLGDVSSEAYLKKLAFAIRVTVEELQTILPLLEENDVLRRSDTGNLFSPWMVERESERKSHAERGAIGGTKAAQARAQATAQAPAQQDGVARAQPGESEQLNHVLKDRVRARASSSSSSSSTSEGVQGEEALPPEIPTLPEFRAWFMADGIPEDYLEEQWAKFQANDDWLARNGNLRDFRIIVRQRWKKDRARWQRDLAETNQAHSPEDRERRKRELEKSLEVETDPAKRAELIRQLKKLLSS